jgi:hypothetical protein
MQSSSISFARYHTRDKDRNQTLFFTTNRESSLFMRVCAVPVTGPCYLSYDGDYLVRYC